MAVHSHPFYRNNHRSNRCNDTCDIKCILQDIIRNCPFFSDPPRTRGENFTKHHDEIKQVYRNWQQKNFTPDTSFPLGIDLATFRPNQLKLTMVEQINPRSNKKDQGLQLTDEMALSHLNCKDQNYKESYKLYLEIEESQNNFNIRMQNFIKSNREHLNEIIGFNDDNGENIGEPLRYYLIKIVDASRLHDEGGRMKSLREEFINIPLGGSEWISNPFTTNETVSIEDMIERYDNIIASIRCFENDIKKLNGLISDFKNSLPPIIANDIKGTCSIEKRSVTSRLKSIFHLC